MKIAFLAAALAALSPSTAALANPGHHHADDRAFGEPGDPQKPARTVEIAMRDADGKMEFAPNRLDVHKGDQIKFVIRNDGQTDHELVLATREGNRKHAIEMEKNPDMEHDDPNAIRLAPKKTGEILWKFTKAGKFDFSCLIPGHRAAGMTGAVVVK